MWRILVVSDSHGNNTYLREAVKKAGDINMMIHLGDVCIEYNEIAGIAGVPTYVVRGNCDYDNTLMDRNVIAVGSHKIYATHGHRQQVQFGVSLLKEVAAQNGCDIAMYGHTHVPYLELSDDGVDSKHMMVLNPGSISKPRQVGYKKTYAIVEIADDGAVSCSIENV